MLNISEQTIQKTGANIMVLFSFLIFINKGPTNISFAFLFLFSICYLIFYGKQDLFLKKRYALILLAPLFFGFLLSFFSYIGPKGAVAFILRFRALFLIVPFVVFVTNRNTLEKIFIAMNIGAFSNIVYGFINSEFISMTKHLQGLYKIGRNSDMLFLICALNIIVLVMGTKKLVNAKPWFFPLLVFNTGFIMSAVFMIGQRAAWLGLYFTLAVFFVFFSRKILLVLILITALVPFYLSEAKINEIKSIVDFENHKSNVTRLKLYKVGFDYISEGRCIFRGTGGKNAGEVLVNYIDTKTKAYKKTYRKVVVKMDGNLHSSWLQMAVEGSLLFLISYLLSVAYLVFITAKKIGVSNLSDKIVLIAGVFIPVGFLVSQMIHEELFRYAGFVYSLILYGGCFIANEYSNQKDNCSVS